MKVDFNLRIDAQQVLRNHGLDENGIVQRTIDQSFIHYMKLKMPRDTGMLASSVREVGAGIVQVQSPYAHYQNKGELYVMDNGKGAYYSPTYGFWSAPNKKKHPSGRPLNYHGGPERGSQFVERTISQNKDDIVREAQRSIL